MRSFRSFLQGPLGRIVTAAIIASSLHAFAEPANYLFAIRAEQAKEAQIREIARKMNVDPEFLLNAGQRRSFDFRGLFDWVSNTLGLRAASTNPAANAQPENVRESIARVKERYALVAADTTLAKLAQLIELSGAPAQERAKKKGQIRAELRSMLRLLDKDLLPPVRDDLPGSAKSRDRDMREAIKDLRKDVQAVLNGPGALDDANLDATLAKLRDAAGDQFTLRNKGPRWTRDPFPVKDTYRFAPVQAAPQGYDAEGAAASAPANAIVATSAKPAMRLAANAVPSEVAALAGTLQTPAKIFTYVHDRVDWESYSGVAKGSLGTLKEAKGNDWDQALLLRDLLAAAGYDAQLEWGRVTLPIAKVMNLVGTEDPLQAANLLATAGFDGILLTAKGAPVAVQMTHVWVRAFIPYIPDRGAKAGTPDTWVRMDPSFKRYEYQPGIAINGKVPWSQDDYLNAALLQQPSQFYGDRIWSYIRTNDIDCVNLSQVAKLGRVKAANFPFVPSTLTTKIDEVRGAAAAPPADQVQNVTISIVSDTGATVGTFHVAIGDLWGKKLSITFPPATPDDAAVIASYGGLFNTPSYLVRLKPVFSLDDQPVAEGFAISAGAALDMNLTFRQPNVADDFTHHQVVAGETHTLVFDAGAFPDDLVQSRIERLKALTAANAPEDAIRSEQLYLVGLRYMQHVDDGLAFATGVRWQRAVKRVFEANVRRQLDISYNIAGAPVRLEPAENNIDVSRLLVGIVPINNDTSNKAEALSLAGLQSSYLEGAIWEEMHSRQGISAAKALLLSKAQGQQLHTVTSANVDAVLTQTSLTADVEAEIRGAVAQGRIARIPSANITLGGWTGTGYILQDPRTGAATYPISGGLAGGSEVADVTSFVQELLGTESWLSNSALGGYFAELFAMLGLPGGNAPSTTQSDPVNMSSGNMYLTVNDFGIQARGIPISVARTYNSRSMYAGPFGYGWTWTYGEQLVPNADGSILWREPDGTEHTFTAAADGTYVAPSGKFVELVRDGTGWVLTSKHGVRWSFDARGLLGAIEDSNGNRVSIQWDTDGLPVSVADAAGRTVLTFNTSGGKIVGITDLAGRTAQYEYSDADLTAVTDTAGKKFTYHYDLDHNLTQSVDPLGNTQTYDYDVDDRLFHHTDAAGAEEFFHYEIAGRNAVVRDKRGGDRYIRFDDRGRATLEADPAGNVITASFDASNNRTAITDSRGNERTFELDAQGNVTRTVAEDGAITLATFNEYSRPLTVTDAAGTTTTVSYDGAGNPMQSTATIGGVAYTSTFDYDSNGQLLSTTNPNGATTSMTWSDAGTLATRTDALDRTATMVSDDLGRITTFKDPAGNTTQYVYDGRDRVVRITDPHGLVTTIEYDGAGRKISETTPLGTTTYGYDPEGRLLSVKDPLGNVTRTAYDVAGDVVARTDARGNVTRYEYDAAGRLVKLTDPSGGIWTYGYCASVGGSQAGGSSACEVTGPDGRSVKQEFDKAGRVVRVADSSGRVTTSQYDDAGRKTLSVDANGNAVGYEYDDGGRLIAVRQANDAVTRYTYDRNGNRLTHTDPNGHVWSFKYDSLDRLIEETDPLERKTTYGYDSLGNLASRTDAKGQVVTYEYDMNRLVKATYPGNVTETFTYDALGRRITAANATSTVTYGYDGLNRVTSVRRQTAQYDLTVRYEYDAAGNLSRMTTPHSATPVTYTYDGANHLTRITDPVFGVFRFETDAAGRRTQLVYPNGVTTDYEYDKASRLAAIATKDAAGTVIDAWSYTYDGAGNPTSKTDLNGMSEAYIYDTVDRLTAVRYADGASETFEYDPAGNRTRAASSRTGAVTTYSYDVANQLSSAGAETFSYDANGNLRTKTTSRGVTTVTYDAKNRITNISSPADGNETNLYDANDRRIDMAGASIENGQVRVIYDRDGNPILDWGTDNLTWTYRLYAPGMDEPLAEYRRQHNRKTFLHRDALGSITAVTRDSGQLAYRSSYTAFGGMSRSSYDVPSTRLGFTGREMSIGTFMQYRSRHYDSGTGRFLQQDAYRGAAAFAQSTHRYAYAHNNPLRYTDPTGRTVRDVENALRFVRYRHPGMAWVQAEIVFFNPIGSSMTLPYHILPFFIMPPFLPQGLMLMSPDMLQDRGDDAGFLGWMAGELYHEMLHIVVCWLMGLLFYSIYQLIASLFSSSDLYGIHRWISQKGDALWWDYQAWLPANNFNYSLLPELPRNWHVYAFDWW